MEVHHKNQCKTIIKILKIRMRILWICIIIALTIITDCSGQIFGFGGGVKSSSLQVQQSSSTSSQRGNEVTRSVTKCQCIPKNDCVGRPGDNITPDVPTDPRVSGTGPTPVVWKYGSQEFGSRIINDPPPGIVCKVDQLYCCVTINDPPTPPPPPPKCGVSKTIPVPGYNRVYGQADFGQYPWMSLIFNDGVYTGSGVLINEFTVLTAAHKIFDAKFPLTIRFGEWDLSSKLEPYAFVEVPVKELLIHPEFNPRSLENDIAILKLKTNLELNKNPHIFPACLPDEKLDYVGQTCWVAGFGATAFSSEHPSAILREVDLPIMDGNTCQDRLRTKTALGPYYNLNKNTFVCAGGMELGKDACKGDGGAPLVCKNTKTSLFDVVGLVSWGMGCGLPGVPGVYVNMQNYKGWIIDNAK